MHAQPFVTERKKDLQTRRPNSALATLARNAESSQHEQIERKKDLQITQAVTLALSYLGIPLDLVKTCRLSSPRACGEVGREGGTDDLFRCVFFFASIPWSPA